VKVIALTGGRRLPSARFRVRQYHNALASHGIAVSEYIPLLEREAKLPGFLGRVRPRYLGPIGFGFIATHYAGRLPGLAASRFADLTWLQRDLLRWGLTFEPYLGRPMVFDIDDAIWLKRPAVAAIARSADAVFAGNSFLADWLSQHAQRVYIVPTAIDTDRFHPRCHRPEGQPFTVGWTGSRSTLRYLEAIQRPLAQFLRRYKDIRLRVVCDQRPSLVDIPRSRIEFILWTPKNEAESVARMDVGLMPLDDGDWERGKCSFKMLQYMASGLPVVVSPVGMNRDVLRHGSLGLAAQTGSEWYDSLMYLYQNRDKGFEMGAVGRQVVATHYSVRVISEIIALRFHELAHR
jgi:glycosyltransferase involved in cell wall biosynthesis